MKKEKVKEYNKKYYKNNKEHIIKQNREYVLRNKDKKRIYDIQYRQKNKIRLYEKKKIYNQKNKVRIALRMKKWNNENKEYIRSYFIEKKYGISYAEYKSIIDKNNGCCPICKNILVLGRGVRDPNAAVVDHDHKTGKVRNVICSNCNMGMGKFKDNIEIIKSVVRYLENNLTSKNERYILGSISS